MSSSRSASRSGPAASTTNATQASAGAPADAPARETRSDHGRSVAAPRAGGASGGRRATVSVGIVGATGYAGGELIRLLLGHPNVRLAGLYGRNRDHQPIAGSHPHLAASGLTIDAELPQADAIFTALPHGVAATMAPEIVGRGSALLDVGPDFRLHNPADYPRWYHLEHSAPELLAGAVYGLPELHRDELRALGGGNGPAVVGLPGCYPTVSILTLAPLARAGLIGDLVVDALSGVSGAGREPKPELLFGEVNESVRAYGLFTHRHTAELEQELQAQAERGLLEQPQANPGLQAVDFLPHLVPMTRGILASCHVRPSRPISQADLDALYEEAYGEEPFVQLVADPPATKHVYGSNVCRIHVRLDERTGRVLALGVIDNLVKGAAGQAVQALNVLFGLPETAGLEQYPVAP